MSTAKTTFWSIADKEAYQGNTDVRYDEFPKSLQPLALQMRTYGTFEQVKHTIERWYITQNWDNFIKNYPYGNCINPYSIKEILENTNSLESESS